MGEPLTKVAVHRRGRVPSHESSSTIHTVASLAALTVGDVGASHLTLFTDNTTAEAIGSQSEKTKHMVLKYLLWRELKKAGVISIEQVDTLVNAAGIGTKNLAKKRTRRSICFGT